MSMDIFVARQPIFDRHNVVMGYELLFRSGSDNFFSGASPDAASARNIDTSLMGFGLDSLTGQRLAFVNVSRGALLEELYTLLPPERTVVELLETVAPDQPVLDACKRLKSAGYRLALDDFVPRPEYEPLLPYADILKIDFRQTRPARIEALADRFRDHGLGLLAEKVETEADRRQAVNLGFHYFQGYFYCRPEMIHGKDIPPSKLNYLRFLSEINKEDVSFDRVEEIIRQEVALSVKLLRYLNSAGFGWRYEVTTIEQALRLLGVRPLRKWASLMAFGRLADDKPQELVVTALFRARFSELLASLVNLPGHDLELFLTGMLSTMDAMVNRPLEDVLAPMAISEPMQAALLEGAPPLGPVLGLVLSYERGDWEGVSRAASGYRLERDRLHQAYATSVRWAEETVGA